MRSDRITSIIKVLDSNLPLGTAGTVTEAHKKQIAIAINDIYCPWTPVKLQVPAEYGRYEGKTYSVNNNRVVVSMVATVYYNVGGWYNDCALKHPVSFPVEWWREYEE